MSKVIKRYQLLTYLQLATSFMVNGTSIPVTFKGGVNKPFLVRGRFSTDDPAMQEAIETDASFGKLFFLEHTFGEEFAEEATPILPKAPETEAEEKATEEVPKVETTEESPEAETTTVPEAEKATEEVVEEAPKDGKPVITDYPEVTNLQEARQKMFELFPGEFKPANMPNKAAVLNKTKEKNITFSKLV